jgi:hypothetical protein
MTTPTTSPDLPHQSRIGILLVQQAGNRRQPLDPGMFYSGGYYGTAVQPLPESMGRCP